MTLRVRGAQTETRDGPLVPEASTTSPIRNELMPTMQPTISAHTTIQYLRRTDDRLWILRI